MQQRATRFIALLALAIPLGTVKADEISALASDNATVQPGGPRSGTSGKNFLNIEGSANGTFASYGVADFSFGVLAQTVGQVNSATLCVTQDNAAFSTTGNLVFSFDKTAMLVDIQPGTSPLAFDGADPGTATDETDGDLDLEGAGTGTYTLGTTGDLDSFPLTLNATATELLVNALNSQATIRLLIGTGDANVAATYAGFSNTNNDGPTLKLDVVFDQVSVEDAAWTGVKALYR